MECSETGGMNNTNAMMHEKQGIVRGPLLSQVAVWRYSTVGTVTSHVTTGIRQPQTRSRVRSGQYRTKTG